MNTYTVKHGDTPMSITRRFTGDARRVGELVRNNPHKPSTFVKGFHTFSAIHPGERLAIPSKWAARRKGLGGCCDACSNGFSCNCNIKPPQPPFLSPCTTCVSMSSYVGAAIDEIHTLGRVPQFGVATARHPYPPSPINKYPPSPINKPFGTSGGCGCQGACGGKTCRTSRKAMLGQAPPSTSSSLTTPLIVAAVAAVSGFGLAYVVTHHH